MPAGNYDEGIDRINLVDAHRQANQDFLRHRQAKRMRSRILGTVAAIVILLSFMGSYWYHAESRRIAGLDVLKTTGLLSEEKFDQALIAADHVIEKDLHPWYGYLYGTVALIHLGRYEEAAEYANKMISYFKKGPFIPDNFLRIYLYAHKLGGTFDVEYEALLSRSMPPYARRAIQDVRDMKDICYQIVETGKPPDIYEKPVTFKCFSKK
jgi:tetratricopeptide (TPR) repeat protein